MSQSAFFLLIDLRWGAGPTEGEVDPETDHILHRQLSDLDTKTEFRFSPWLDKPSQETPRQHANDDGNKPLSPNHDDIWLGAP